MATDTGGQQTRVTVAGTIKTDFVPLAAVDAFLLADGRLARWRGATVFFGGAALATLPTLAAEPPPWLAALLVGEGVVALISGCVWLSRRSAAKTARGALTNQNRLVMTTEYSHSLEPPPTKRAGPEPPEVNET